MTILTKFECYGKNIFNSKKKEKRISELIKLTDLEAKIDILVKDLSVGMKRRLELARELMTKPAVLFLDEPTVSFDIQTGIILLFGRLIRMSFFKGYDPTKILISVLGIFLLVGIFTLGFLFLSGSISISAE